MSLLQLIETCRSSNPRRVMLYGVHGIGKSTFGAMVLRPIFLQTEDGLADIDAPRFPLAGAFEDVIGALMVVILLAHAKIERFENPQTDTYDLEIGAEFQPPTLTFIVLDRQFGEVLTVPIFCAEPGIRTDGVRCFTCPVRILRQTAWPIRTASFGSPMRSSPRAVCRSCRIGPSSGI